MECFTVLSNEIEGRLDCFYYNPVFIELEKKIRSKTKKILGDYILNIAGGATPEKDESDKYYTESPNEGVPFIRVQNLGEEGLKLDDCKYIKCETHNTMLKRSQVKEYNLLTKITGVGRMAISSIAPKGFEGNINQHVVVMQTSDYETSKVLAAFLNSDIGEKLAFRRSTGGTRPALDYQALKTIPIIFEPKIVEIMQKAYVEKKRKEQEAEIIINSLNNFVLQLLNIKVSEINDKLCFVVFSDEIVGKRCDPKKYTVKPTGIIQAISKAKYNTKELSSLIQETISGEWGEDEEKEEQFIDYINCSVLRNTNFDNRYNLNLHDVAQRLLPQEKYIKTKLIKGDILVEKSGGSPIQPVGRVAIIQDSNEGYGFSNFLQCVRLNQEKVLPEYVFAYLRALYGLGYMEYLQNQTTGIKNLIMEEFLSIQIPLPPLSVQKEIAKIVLTSIEKAKQLEKEARNIIEEAKKKVEEIILGKIV
ncbi:MAG: restriction endonuclease subunit S [Elusimicrobia bacterium]|nr:restriction endonuclease subunit S [Candidatus Liberimonas magnetica]